MVKKNIVSMMAMGAVAVAVTVVTAACTAEDFTSKFVGESTTTAAVSGESALPEYVSGTAVEIEEYDVNELVELAEYKGVEVDCTVTDEEVQSEIDELLEENPDVTEIKEGTAKTGDKVNIDYSGALDGEKFDGGTAEDQEITLGESGMIDGFDDAIIGMKVGETKDAELTLPDPYENNPDLAGKKTVFTMKLNYIVEESPATFDDAFVKAHTDYKTVDEYKEKTKEELAQAKKDDAGGTAMSKVFDESTVSNVPVTLVLAEKEALRVQYTAQAEMYGMTLESMMAMSGMTEDQFEQMLEESAREITKQQLVCEAIAIKENIDFSDTAIDAYINDMVEKNGSTVDDIKSSYATYYGEAMPFERYMRDAYIYEKVLELVGDNAKIIE